MSRHPLTRALAYLVRDLIFGRPRRRRSRRRSPGLTHAQVSHLAARIAVTTARVPGPWGLLPDWKGPSKYRYSSTTNPFDVDLSLYSCPCEDWVKHRARLQHNDIRRCCRHLAEALWKHPEVTGLWPNGWTRIVAAGLTDWAFPIEFEQAIFSNGIEDFLCVYDIARGHVQLFAASGGQHYSLSMGSGANKDRWSNEVRPKACVLLKKAMRPWKLAMDAKHRNGS